VIDRERRYWQIPEIWPGGECFILGGGPSVAAVSVSGLQGRRVIAVNQSHKIAPFAEVCFFADCSWWHRFGERELLGFSGLKVTTCIKLLGVKGVKVCRKQTSPAGLVFGGGALSWNRSSGACAINLAVALGAKRIVLLGFDMRDVGERAHWHDDYAPIQQKVLRLVGRARKVEAPYSKFLISFAAIARDAERRRIEIVNATPGSAIREFPIVDPGILLQRAPPVDKDIGVVGSDPCV